MKKSELRDLYHMMFPDYPDIVTVAQLQKMLGISRHLAYDLINDGHLAGMKIGNSFKIPKVSVITTTFCRNSSRKPKAICSPRSRPVVLKPNTSSF